MHYQNLRDESLYGSPEPIDSPDETTDRQRGYGSAASIHDCGSEWCACIIPDPQWDTEKKGAADNSAAPGLASAIKYPVQGF